MSKNLAQAKRLTNSTAISIQKSSDCKESVNLLHFGCFICSSFHFLKWWEIIIISKSFIVIIYAQTKLNHPMDAACELRGFIQIETRCQQGCVKEQPNQIFDSLV